MTLKVNRRTAPDAIRAQKDFINSTGSLRGYARGVSSHDPGSHLTGWLDDDERARYLSDAQRGITYLVVSYDTPIAWVVDGEWYRVSQYFSNTTSHHMGLIPRAGTAA